MIATLGVPHQIAIVIMGVFVASFAGTTLDTATRIQRYVISELGSDLKFGQLRNRHLATSFAVLTAAVLAFASGADGKGALALWPLFGAVNQTLAALALILATLYLRRMGGWKWIITGVPAIFMSVMTLWASVMNQTQFGSDNNLLLQVINAAIVLIVAWIILEGTIKFLRGEKAPSKEVSLSPE
jgi:carbon starvation protein